MGCIAPHALLSGLVLRVEREGYVPTRADLEALLGAGCSADDVRAALARGAARRSDRPFAHGLSILESIVKREVG